jgi:hypothetical protein
MPFFKNNTLHRKTRKLTRQCNKHDKGRETGYYCPVGEVDGCFEGFHTRNNMR